MMLELEYRDLMSPLASTLHAAMRQALDQHIAALDDCIAAAIITALATNGVRSAQHIVSDSAEVFVYRVTEDPAAAWPYVAVVEWRLGRGYLWLHDENPETVQTEAARLLARATEAPRPRFTRFS
jgi:hypothetical protein